MLSISHPGVPPPRPGRALVACEYHITAPLACPRVLQRAAACCMPSGVPVEPNNVSIDEPVMARTRALTGRTGPWSPLAAGPAATKSPGGCNGQEPFDLYFVLVLASSHAPHMASHTTTIAHAGNVVVQTTGAEVWGGLTP